MATFGIVLHALRSSTSNKLYSRSLCRHCLIRNISVWQCHPAEDHNPSKMHLRKQRVPLLWAKDLYPDFTYRSLSGASISSGLSTAPFSYNNKPLLLPAIVRNQSQDSKSKSNEGKKSRWSNWTGKNAWKLSLVILGLTFTGMTATVVCSWGKSLL